MTAGAPRIVFFGTPEFALPALAALHASGSTISAVVSQPDRPAGRGLVPTPSPVTTAARRLGVRVYTPSRLAAAKEIETLLMDQIDVAVVAAYGNLIPESLLRLPRRGFLNLHPSLLPRYRGASPIQAALLAGDAETGVSLMLLDAGLDTGPILDQRRVAIQPTDDAISLANHLAEAGAQLLTDSLPPYLRGERPPQPQDPTRATLTKPFTRDDGKLKWHMPAKVLERMVRALRPWPGTWTVWQQKRVRILEVLAVPGSDAPGHIAAAPPLRVGCGEGSLQIERLAFAGGRPMTGLAALQGYRLAGSSFDA